MTTINGKGNTIVNTSKKTTPAQDPLAAEIQRLRAENEALKAQKSATAAAATLKVSEKGAVSLYGMGRWPLTVYAFTKASIEAGTPVFEGSQAHTLMMQCIPQGADYTKSKLYQFVVANKAELVKRQRASLAAKATESATESNGAL